MKKDLSKLTDIQKHVTQENGTEAPYKNPFWDFFEPGVYVDIISGEVLFSSTHKYKSHCGWPSFYKALVRENIVKLKDSSTGMERIEVRSKHADSHLGHIFTDGPAPTGVRYCINSAALKFISKDKLVENDLGNYVSLFEDSATTQDVALENVEYATFGAGCFWGVQAIFSKTNGVVTAQVGYCGGKTIDPTYEQISLGNTGHAETVQVKFDNTKVSYQELLDLFWRLHDPTTLNSQGHDIGSHYRSVIFYHDQKQAEIALEMKNLLDSSGKLKTKIVTEVTAFTTFFLGEEYHQDYYEKKYQGELGPICHFVRGE